MNPVTLEAIKLLLELNDNPNISMDQKVTNLQIIEKMLFIIEKDVNQAYAKYSAVLN